ncbi:unnamed protein product [Durusdinium trenchii]|uniref:Integrase catalytic domain-containing protein n=1 Tax=Durusdinium trenchii TaxID=1381693 RepID=A0ABP0P6R4_9DINO
MSARLECDRHGVPQFDGTADVFEYEERAWDLFYGRAGNDATQIATPIHLRSGLTAAAYDAVRKLSHESLCTSRDGKETDAGMKLLIRTLKESIAAEVPVRINELFLTAFYSPQVWRKPSETMQQYIVRREQDFNRLLEASSGTQVSDNLRSMMLLIFSGLDHREQLSVLASVGNEYDFKKISHALRIQYPQATGKPLARRDYLGASRGSRSFNDGPPQSRYKWKMTQKAQIFYEDEVPEDDEPADEAFVNYDDEDLEALLSENRELLDDSQVAEAYATIAQFKKKKQFSTSPKKSSGGQGGPYPFKATGELSFDAKAKEQRKSAVRFLKSVTPCTTCGQRGHWSGDAECPQRSNTKKGKGKGSQAKKKASPKRTSQSFFVLHDQIESDEEAEVQFTETCNLKDFQRPFHAAMEKEWSALVANNVVLEHPVINIADTSEVPPNDMDHENVLPPTYDLIHEYADMTANDPVLDSIDGTGRNADAYMMANDPVADPSDGNGPGASFTASKFSECFVNFKSPILCEHARGNGGPERQYHRGANGHTRHLSCKDCDKTVLVARRKEPVQLWGYMVQVLMATKWGSALRSEGLYRYAGRLTHEYARERDGLRPLPPPRGSSAMSAAPSAWELATSSRLHHQVPLRKCQPHGSCDSPGIRPGSMECNLHQVLNFRHFHHLQEDILIPLPSDQEPLMLEQGTIPFAVASASPEYEPYCQQVLQHALDNQPMDPTVYRFAFYLYGKVKLAWAAGHRLVKGAGSSAAKRGKSEDMTGTRYMIFPVRADPSMPAQVASECMMVASEEIEENVKYEAFALEAQDPPGLAILDSGCTRTMHGSEWAHRFEEEISKYDLVPKVRDKRQTFKGIGGAAESKIVKVFPVGIGGSHGVIHSAETDGQTPMLISRPFMQALGTIIDLKNNTVSFSELGISSLPLHRTRRGHLAISLLDFSDIKSNIDFEKAQISEFPEEEVYIHDETYELPIDARIDYDEYDMNPDDYQALFLDLDEPPDDGHHCDDEDIFLSMVDEGHFTTRKPSSKKGKKLESMNLSLDGDDYNRSRILKNENTIKVKRRPPCGKTWFNQLFAGQLGISLLGILIGMSIGTPLDIASSSWDASTAAGRRRLHQDYQVEDPYCTIITHPCGPWGSWSRFNLAKGGQAAETVKALRESNREVLKTVNKTVKDRLRAKRHVFIEQPAGTESLCEDEMKDIMNYITSGDLILLRVDGCMVGYHDRESKLPHYKPSIYIASMIAAESIFANKCCSRDHRHETLEGNNIYGSRTTQAAEWSSRHTWLQLWHTVYIRPGQLEDPLPQEPQDDDETPQDDHDFRAERAAALDPILNIGEGDNSGSRSIRRSERSFVTFIPTLATAQTPLSKGSSVVKVQKKKQFEELDFWPAMPVVIVVCCMGLHSGVPSSSVALRHFATSWTSWCGLPYSIQVDRGKEFMARFADHLKTFGIEQEVMPLEAPWKGGRCERAGGLWKDLWIKTCLERQIVGLDDVILATGIVTQTRNSFPRSNGYSPNQWVLGVPELRLPGSLLTNEAGQSDWTQTLVFAEPFFVRALQQEDHTRLDPYKKQLGPQRVTDKRQYNWFGPARVIGVELRNPRRLEDQDPPTESGQPHSYWLRYGPSVVLATGEQLRFASEDELLAAHCIPSYAVQSCSLRGARNYVDARPLQLENLNLPGGSVVDFWHVSGDGRVVRVHQQPRLLLFHPADQGCPVDLDQLQNVRVTEAIYTAEARDHALTDTIEDDWRASDPQEQRPLTFQWTGETIFYLINQPDGDDGDMVYTPSVPPQDLPGGEDLPPVPEDNELDAPQPPQRNHSKR